MKLVPMRLMPAPVTLRNDLLAIHGQILNRVIDMDPQDRREFWRTLSEYASANYAQEETQRPKRSTQIAATAKRKPHS